MKLNCEAIPSDIVTIYRFHNLFLVKQQLVTNIKLYNSARFLKGALHNCKINDCENTFFTLLIDFRVLVVLK